MYSSSNKLMHLTNYVIKQSPDEVTDMYALWILIMNANGIFKRKNIHVFIQH